jgi:hypothetical protein
VYNSARTADHAASERASERGVSVSVVVLNTRSFSPFEATWRAANKTLVSTPRLSAAPRPPTHRLISRRCRWPYAQRGPTCRCSCLSSLYRAGTIVAAALGV